MFAFNLDIKIHWYFYQIPILEEGILNHINFYFPRSKFYWGLNLNYFSHFNSQIEDKYPITNYTGITIFLRSCLSLISLFDIFLRLSSIIKFFVFLLLFNIWIRMNDEQHLKIDHIFITVCQNILIFFSQINFYINLNALSYLVLKYIYHKLRKIRSLTHKHRHELNIRLIAKLTHSMGMVLAFQCMIPCEFTILIT